MRSVLAIAAIVFSASAAQAVEAGNNAFITLGTAGGPEALSGRAQPANALVVNKDLYLVDAGDGVAAQLRKAGYRLPEVDGLFISHLHFDHTGGVLAVLGLRMQLNARETLDIYGPPGTREFVEGLLAGVSSITEAAYGMPGQSWKPMVQVTEMEQGDVVELDGLTVTAAENTHFKIPEASGMAEKAKSLAYRFDMEARSIVFTGDTGPSKAVEELAKDADLLVSEMMDIPVVLDDIRKVNPGMPETVIGNIEWHFRAHHVLPKQVGEMAARAAVGKVVVTHMVPDISTPEMKNKYLEEIGAIYQGPVSIAADLDRF